MKDYRARPDLLAERVILVTGAGDGLGKAASLSFAAHGATVILLGRTLKKLERVYDEIEKAGHPQPAIYPMNLEGATPKDYEELSNVVRTNFGRIDGILHNAAEMGTLTPLVHYDVMTWVKVLQANLTAPFLLTQSLLPLLIETGETRVMFTHDEVADSGKAYWGAYGASKGGALTLMRTLANELEANTGVRVNAVCPGPVATRLRLRAYPAENRAVLPRPADLMGTYLYLMGPDSQSLTGQVVTAEPDSKETK